MKYTAINIGPIISTLSMARKPRELWAASYMFSFFMECILNELNKLITRGELDKDAIISPAIDTGGKSSVGLYPDRVFIKGELNVKDILQNALKNFTSVNGNGVIDVDENYINTMSVMIDFDETKAEPDTINSSPIRMLNYLLDCAELSNRTIKPGAWEKALNLIRMKNDSPLYACTGKKSMYIPMLGEIAAWDVQGLIDKYEWKSLCEIYRKPEDRQDESGFYKKIKEWAGDAYKSYYKYVCVVQADGDRMGSVVSALPVNQVKDLSEGLLKYCKTASNLIKNYGGLPIYAGGDDLLFIAPVVSCYAIEGNSAGKWCREMPNTIFDLLDKIDACFQKEVDDLLDYIDCPLSRDGKSRIKTSLSYGLSITYYKYPLYEALESARTLLFDKAKKVNKKNAIAWCLRKHSGSEFSGQLNKRGNVYNVFRDLLKCSVDQALISAVAHKLRENDDLLSIILEKGNNRLEAFYEEVIEAEKNDKTTYKWKTKQLLEALCQENGSNATQIDLIIEQMYGMLRTAKFINGEEDKDE